jgi:hypothetical protein
VFAKGNKGDTGLGTLCRTAILLPERTPRSNDQGGFLEAAKLISIRYPLKAVTEDALVNRHWIRNAEATLDGVGRYRNYRNVPYIAKPRTRKQSLVSWCQILRSVLSVIVDLLVLFSFANRYRSVMRSWLSQWGFLVECFV